MEEETVRRDYYSPAPTERRYTRTNWSWVLLLPLFFVFGWFANDYSSRVQPTNTTGQNQPVYGVGGGPGASVAPTTDTVNQVVPTVDTQATTLPQPTVATTEPTEKPTTSAKPSASAKATETP